MANFKVHISVSTLASSTGALYLLNIQQINIFTCVWLAFVGALGGIVPDIDSEHSTSIRVVFASLGAICAVTLGYLLKHQLSLIFLFLSVLSGFLLVYWGIRALVMHLTVHRGACHSMMFASLSGLLLADFMMLLDFNGLLCWLSGGFLFVGMIIHLILDEIYSIDVMNRRVKSSFGSALKIFSYKEPYIYSGQLILILALFWLAPNIPEQISTQWVSLEQWIIKLVS